MLRDQGNCIDDYVRLSDDLIWHTPRTVFGPCPCVPGRDHYDPVQGILPLDLSKESRPRSQAVELSRDGAVIFGHSSHFPWIRGDAGPLRKGELKEPAWSADSPEMDSCSLKDSGIGSGLTVPTSVSHASSRSTSSMQHPVTPPSQESPIAGRADQVPSVNNQRHIRGRYAVGILCALPKELKAVRALFDNKHSSVETIWGNSNHYALGEMAAHMVVATCLPVGGYGTNLAAAAATKLRRSFHSLRFCLLVGIGG